MGLVATPHCGIRLSLLEEGLARGGFDLAMQFVQYPVPLSNGHTETMWAVSWPAQYPLTPAANEKAQDNGMTGREFFLQQIAQYPVPSGTESKYANTVAFFDWYRTHVGRDIQTERGDFAKIAKTAGAAEEGDEPDGL